MTLNRIIRYINLDPNSNEVIRKSFHSTIVKVVGMIMALLVSVYLARVLGVENLGLINLANRIVGILVVFGLLGTRNIIIRRIAIDVKNEDDKKIGDTIYTAYWLNGLFTLAVSIILIISSKWISGYLFNAPELRTPLVILLLGLIPQVFSLIYSSALVGHKRIWQSNLFEQTLSIILVAIILLVLQLIEFNINVFIVAVIYTSVRILVTIIAATYWHRIFKLRKEWNCHYKKLFYESKPLFISTLSNIMINNLDVIFLGIYGSMAEVGLYTVLTRIATMPSFFLKITNSILGPKIAALFSDNNILEINLMVKRITKFLVFVGFAALLIFTFSGTEILAIWGDEFKDGYKILLILSLGQLINLSTGSVGQILIMTGNEKKNRDIVVLSLFFCTLANFVFVQLYGILGVAIVNVMTISILNLMRLFFARKMLGISTL